MKVKTSVLKKLLDKSAKNVGNRNILAITGLLSIALFDDGFIQLTTFDGSNYLIVTDNIGSTDNLYATIYANSFIALIGKLDSEYVDISIDETSLVVTSGRGVYKFEIAYEQNEIVLFDVPQVNDENEEVVSLEKFLKCLTINEGSVSITIERPSLNCAYFDENIVTTDGYRACVTPEKVFSTPKIIPYSLLKLLTAFDDEEVVSVKVEDRHISICGNSVMVVGELPFALADYPYDSVVRLVNNDLDNSVVLSKSDLLACMGRLNIFMSKNEDNLSFSIKDKVLTITSVSTYGKDELLLSEDCEDTNFVVNVNYFKSLVNSCPSNTVKLGYSKNGFTITITDENAVRLLALIRDANNE